MVLPRPDMLKKVIFEKIRQGSLIKGHMWSEYLCHH